MYHAIREVGTAAIFIPFLKRCSLSFVSETLLFPNLTALIGHGNLKTLMANLPNIHLPEKSL